MYRLTTIFFQRFIHLYKSNIFPKRRFSLLDCINQGGNKYTFPLSNVLLTYQIKQRTLKIAKF